ncbi:SO_0444 family Cu/Zn efflux transporter [Reinekea thalattae]|uniref:Permease n=1 Tax=Reinekea thalattae TaxID=2593301 RepID=A0A5C8Z887_9GAMM|nr:SO_0444 family Cu/Zn efflux transporter [Reinekea thalattae]TXR53867.1 permease [Reinekea thalattae]
MIASYFSDFIASFVFLFTESAPFLLLGLFIAGVIHILIPSAWVQKTLGKRNSMVTAAFIGAPVPLCSCSVIPTAIGIRRSGASKASTASFMVATPETGVDSVGVTYALLGPIMAIIRPVSAIIAAIFTGLLVQWWDKETPAKKGDASASCCSSEPAKTESSSCCSSKSVNESTKAESSSCCSSKPSESVNESAKAVSSSCCSSKPSESVNEPAKTESSSCCSSKANSSSQTTQYPWLTKLKNCIKYSYGKLLGDFMQWLLIGLVFAALIRAFVPESFLAEHGSGLISMMIMVLISIPMYICATASTPIAAGLMLSGISPGAALVFMMAGPATNVATIMVVKNELGTRSMYAYLAGVISSALALGALTDWAFAVFDLHIEVTSGHHGDMTSLLYSLSAVVLAVLMLWNGYNKYKPAASAH